VEPTVRLVINTGMMSNRLGKSAHLVVVERVVSFAAWWDQLLLWCSILE
jgi:hypothetical protein